MKKLLMVLPAAAAALKGWPVRFDITRYEILTPAVRKPVRFAVLADVHDTWYGENMERVTDLVRQETPDAILIPGDLCQEKTENRNSFLLMEQLKDYPVFYCTGNHEERRKDVEAVKQDLRDRGVIVLDGRSVAAEFGGSLFEIGGISSRNYKRGPGYTAEEVNALFHTDGYRILLSHQPQWIDLYKALDCDLTVCGHAHGGQWRFPGTGQGLIAPNQGLLPKYTSGIHALGRNHEVISRGMAWHYHGIPRMYNNPEFVMITVAPKGERSC